MLLLGLYVELCGVLRGKRHVGGRGKGSGGIMVIRVVSRTVWMSSRPLSGDALRKRDGDCGVEKLWWVRIVRGHVCAEQ